MFVSIPNDFQTFTPTVPKIGYTADMIYIHKYNNQLDVHTLQAKVKNVVPLFKARTLFPVLR